MEKRIPELTRRFMESIVQNAEKGVIRSEVGGISIDTYPYVFPPESPFSDSMIDDRFLGDLKGKTVLDVGTGTGILAIKAALAGAMEVHAVDIFEPAVRCAAHNVIQNGLKGKVRVYYSDIFSEVPDMSFDLIVANLPILDLPQKDERFHSLFDPGFECHKRLFRDASNYLKRDGNIIIPHSDINGSIIMSHADLCSYDDFRKLEDLAGRFGFAYRIKGATRSLGHEWRIYEFFLL